MQRAHHAPHNRGVGVGVTPSAQSLQDAGLERRLPAEVAEGEREAVLDKAGGGCAVELVWGLVRVL